MKYPWYTVCNSTDPSLEQGDFIKNCPIVIPPESIDEEDEPNIVVEEIDSIILSQSCDLEHGKISLVLVCPYMNLQDWIYRLNKARNEKWKDRKKTIEELKKGALPGYHLLNSNPKYEMHDFLVVDFKNVYGINYALITNLIKNRGQERMRLLSPYKEHLSQAFARYFMRVGLPNNVEIDDNYFKNGIQLSNTKQT